MNLPDEKREAVAEVVARALDVEGMTAPVPLEDHIADALAPLLAKWLAEAWREGYQAGETDWHDGKSDNPYRADAAETTEEV